MARRKIKNKEQTFEVSQDDLQGYYSRYLPQYGPGGPLPATNPWFKIANLGNKLSNFKNVSNKDIKAKDYMKFSLTNTAKAGDLSGDETEFLMKDDGTFQVDENNKKIPNPLYDTGNRYLSMDEKNNPVMLTYGQNRAKLLNPIFGPDSERVKSGRFSARRVNPVTGKVEYVNPDGSVRTSGDIAEDQLQPYNAESFNFDKDNNVVSWNTTKYNDYNEPTEIITNPYDVNNPFNIKDPYSKQKDISDDYFKKDIEEIDENENIHPKSQKQITEEYLKKINQNIDETTKTDAKYGGQLPKAQNSEEFLGSGPINWSAQFDEAELQGALDAQAENYGIADAADIDPMTGMPTTGSLSTYGEVWSGEGWEDVAGVTPTTDDFKVDDMAWHNDQLVPEAGGSAFVQDDYVTGDGQGDLTLGEDKMKLARKNLKKKEKADKKAERLANREQKAKKRKMWGDNLAQQATNFGNYLFDKTANSKPVAALDMVKDVASIYTDVMDNIEADRMENKKFQGMNTIDNLVDPLEANAEGTKGNYDTLTGLLRIDDAVVSELARDGKELYQVGGEPESLTSLRRFTEELPTEIGYNEEDILNQKLSLAQMKKGGSNICPVCGKLKSQCGCNYKTGGDLPKAQNSWETIWNTTKDIYNKGSDIFNTGAKRAGITSITPYIGSTAANILGVGSSAYGLLDANLKFNQTLKDDSSIDKTDEEIDSDVSTMYSSIYSGPSSGGSFYSSMKKTGGQLPKAQYGYISSRDGKSNLNQSLKLAGTTALLSGLTRGLTTGITNRGNYKSAYNDYINNQGTDWYEEMCTTGTCPSWEENRLALLDGHAEPNFAWFRGTDDNLFGKQYVMNNNNVLQKGDLADAYWKNVKQGIKDGLYTGAINYGLNYLTDRTKIGSNVKNWWQDKGLPNISVGYLSRKHGGEQVDIDEQMLQELIAAGADIEIL